jgi:hypothetical protein
MFHDLEFRQTLGAPPANWMQAASFQGVGGEVRHGFSSKLTNLPRDSFTSVLRRDLGQMGLPPRIALHTVTQVHSAEIIDVRAAPHLGTAADRDSVPLGTADGMILNSDQVAVVAIQAADCVPILAVQNETGACAALHAGWRGTAAGILPRLIERWTRDGGAGSMEIVLGPSIRGCCYEVREDCLSAFSTDDLAHAVDYRDGRSFLDLTRVLRNQARRCGVDEPHIEVLGSCTYCTAENGAAPYASFRRDGQPGRPFPQRNAAFIGRWRDER